MQNAIALRFKRSSLPFPDSEYSEAPEAWGHQLANVNALSCVTSSPLNVSLFNSENKIILDLK